MSFQRIRLVIFSAAAVTCLTIFYAAFHEGLRPSDIAHFANKHLGQQGQGNTDGLAYMTFLTGTMANASDPDLDHDPYFVATRILGYQLMHQPETKTQANIPFVVLVTDDVPSGKRERLARDGATVIPVEDLRPTNDWVIGEMPQWANVMTKLRAWEQTQYSRAVLLDGDTILNGCLDGLFHDEATQLTESVDNDIRSDEGFLYGRYVLGSIPEANPFHAYPPTTLNGDFKDPNYFNAGFFVFAPAKDMFDYYVSILEIGDRFDPQYPEQNLLNYAHRQEGPVPWRHMDTAWNIRFPHVEDKAAGVVSMHDKWWSAHMDKGLQPFYDSARWKMEGFYEGMDEGHGL